MSIEFKCPKCKRKYSVDEKYAVKRLKCKNEKCRAMMQVPETTQKQGFIKYLNSGTNSLKKAFVGIKSGLDTIDEKLLYSSQKQQKESETTSDIVDAEKTRDTEDNEIVESKQAGHITDKRPISEVSDNGILPEHRSTIYKKKHSKLPGIIGIILILTILGITIFYIMYQEGASTPGDVLKNVSSMIKGKEGNIIGTWFAKNSEANSVIRLYENKRYYVIKEEDISSKSQGKWDISENTLFLDADTIFGPVSFTYEIVKLDNKTLIIKNEDKLTEYEKLNIEDDISDETLREIFKSRDNFKKEPEYYPISNLKTVSVNKWEDMWERRNKSIEDLRDNGSTTIDVEDRLNQFDILFKKYAVSITATVVDIEYAKNIFSKKKNGLNIKFELEVDGIMKNWRNDNWFRLLYVNVSESKRNMFVKGSRWRLVIRINGNRYLDYSSTYSPYLENRDVLIESID